MTTYTKAKALSYLLLLEVCPGWSMDKASLSAGSSVAMGQIVKVITGNQYEPATAQSMGELVIGNSKFAVVAEAASATDEDSPLLVIARGAVVNASALVWPTDVTVAQKAMVIEKLESRGILVRSAV